LSAGTSALSHKTAEKSRKIAGDCVRIAASIIDPTIVG
jgi:hypothetical protein